VCIIDITDRLHLEITRQTFEKGNSPMVMIDSQGQILRWNEASNPLIRYRAAHLCCWPYITSVCFAQTPTVLCSTDVLLGAWDCVAKMTHHLITLKIQYPNSIPSKTFQYSYSDDDTVSTLQAATEVFGYTKEEALDRNICFLMPEPHRSNHGKYLMR